MRTAFTAVLFASLAGVAAQTGGSALKPTQATFSNPNATLGEVAAELSKLPAGVTVSADPRVIKQKCPAAFADTPFWTALETAADRTGTRLAIRDGGRSIALEPLGPKPREVSAVAGTFRVVPRKVTGQVFLDGGGPTHEVELEVHWEPRMPVFRIDTHPRITKAEDDRGTTLTAGQATALHYPGGAARTDMSVKLTGLTRAAKNIGVLAGEFRATAAEKLLAVPFKDLGGKYPQEATEAGVKVAVKSFAKSGTAWEAELELLYPEGHPIFESFEEQKWLRDTRVRLVSPAGKPLDPDGEDATASGRRVTGTYRFKPEGDPTGKGWSLVCETPSPLVEVKVPFELKGIPLP